jgi:hypothetical protein
MTEKDREQKNPEVKELVLARINVMPPNYKLSVGNQGTFTKEQLIENVGKGNEIGNQIIDMQMNFIKALTSGKLMETINK